MGKSTVTAVKAVHRAYTRPGSQFLVASPTARRSGEWMRKARAMVELLGIKPVGDGTNQTPPPRPTARASRSVLVAARETTGKKRRKHIRPKRRPNEHLRLSQQSGHRRPYRKNGPPPVTETTPPPRSIHAGKSNFATESPELTENTSPRFSGPTRTRALPAAVHLRGRATCQGGAPPISSWQTYSAAHRVN